MDLLMISLLLISFASLYALTVWCYTLVNENRGGIIMWIVMGTTLVLLFGYLGHALLHPENY